MYKKLFFNTWSREEVLDLSSGCPRMFAGALNFNSVQGAQQKLKVRS